MIRIFLFLPLLLFATPDTVIKRIESHRVLKDYSSAIIVSKEALESYPDDPRVLKSALFALSEGGDGEEAIALWEQLKGEGDDTLIEALAWGVLKTPGNHLNAEIATLLSASQTHDVRAVPIFIEALRSTNAFIRSVAAGLVRNYGDAVLIDELLVMLEKESVWYVRLKVMETLGMLQVKRAAPILKKIIADGSKSFEEKAYAIASIVTIREEISEDELRACIQSDRAGLKNLGCHLVSHLEQKNLVDEVKTLLKDHAFFVRKEAIVALTLLGAEVPSEMMYDTHPEVAITAAWARMRSGDPEGEERLKFWALSSYTDSRRFAATRIGRVGLAGKRVALEAFAKSYDPFVKVNLALGLLAQRVEVDQMSRYLHSFLNQTREKIMWEEGFIFPTAYRHTPEIPQYPLMCDQMARLQILNTLAIFRYEGVLDATKAFLQNQVEGVTFAAATLLLEEGDDEAIEVIRKLQKSDETMIRLQAAVVLALFGETDDVLPILEKAYSQVPRNMQLNIIGAMGHLGKKESIDFLVSILRQPFPVMKKAAAAALIQCVYH